MIEGNTGDWNGIVRAITELVSNHPERPVLLFIKTDQGLIHFTNVMDHGGIVGLLREATVILEERLRMSVQLQIKDGSGEKMEKSAFAGIMGPKIEPGKVNLNGESSIDGRDRA